MTIEPTSIPVQNTVVPPTNPVETFETAYKKFTNPVFHNRTWSSDKIGEIERRQHLFLLYFGKNKDINTITRNDLLELRFKMTQMPTRITDNNLYKGLITVDEIIQARQDYDFDTIALSTANKFLRYMGNFWKFCAQQELIHKNPHSNMEIDTAGMEVKRVPYSDEDLANIFTSSFFTVDLHKQLKKTPEHIFIPLLGLCQGMRMNEIAQLHVDDITLHNKIWCIDCQRRS